MRNVGSIAKVCVWMVFGLLPGLAWPTETTQVTADRTMIPSAQPNALLSVDQNRTTVIERVVGQWGAPLEQSNAGLSSAQLRTMLQGLRADHLLAASLAGSLTGLRDVLANSLVTPAAATSTRARIKAIGDVADDLVYTPVSPCRLFDSRPAQGGLGVLNPNVRRTYGATTPVTNQGGPGGCVAPTGAAVALIQIGTLTPAGNGYLQGGPQGVASFPNALILYQPGDQYGTSVAMPLNVTNGRFDVQVQFAATDLYGDLLGYFARPKNYGGTHSITGLYATDSGGFANNVAGDYSTNGGGSSNQVFGNYGTVAGGSLNLVNGNYGTITGGSGNNVDGDMGTVAGGLLNRASGFYGAVPGGYFNFATGNYSLAAGNSAKALHDGCFVWGDTSTGNTVSCGFPNQFVVRSLQGFYFFTGGSTDATYTGASLAPGATSWTTYSDRAGKDNVQRIDPADVLSKVAALPIATWNWKSQDASIRHMGPMAQDFHAAFGLGETSTGISTVDADGVALAAIQGLNVRAEEQMAVIREQQREITELTHQMQDMRNVVADVLALKAALTGLSSDKAIVSAK